MRSIALLALATATAAAQQPMARVDIKADGAPANGNVYEWTPNPISADGRWIVFGDSGADLVPGDTNGTDDIFVRDLVTGTTARVSLANNEAEANGQCYAPCISGDGRFVAFASNATNLVPNDTNNYIDIFLRDRDPDGDGIYDEANSTTTRISKKTSGKQSDGYSERPSIAADGSYVAFESYGDLDVDRTGTQIYGYDIATGAIECLSAAANGSDCGGYASHASVSDDGMKVAFDCYGPNVVAGDTNGFQDIFLRDRTTATTTLVSRDSAGTQGNGNSFQPSLSGNGAYVAFASGATNFFSSDTNQSSDVLWRDLSSGVTELVSRANDGTPGDRASSRPWLSTDGQILAFESDARNLLSEDTNILTDVFVLDRASGLIELVSQTCVGWSGNQISKGPSLSGDGRWVGFFSRASDLMPDLIGGDRLYLRDRATTWPEASRRVFGAGWPGTKGIPAIDATADPEFGATFDVTADNSSGKWNVGFLLIGFDEATIPTNLGGTIFVDLFAIETVVLPPYGWALTVDVPEDPALCGVEYDVQLVEVDPGASVGLSFTPALELIFGR